LVWLRKEKRKDVDGALGREMEEKGGGPNRQ
jgi:hypothetical protein